MPKSYQNPEQKQEHEREQKPHRTVGVYEQPEKAGSSKGIMIALAVILAIIIVFLIYRLASGDTEFTAARNMAVQLKAMICQGSSVKV